MLKHPPDLRQDFRSDSNSNLSVRWTKVFQTNKYCFNEQDEALIGTRHEPGTSSFFELQGCQQVKKFMNLVELSNVFGGPHSKMNCVLDTRALLKCNECTLIFLLIIEIKLRFVLVRSRPLQTYFSPNIPSTV